MATVNTNWTNPASATLDKATGATIDETMTDAWSSNHYHLGGTAGYIGCYAITASTQSIANSTFTEAALGGEGFDSDPNGAMHDTSTNNSRVTIRTTGVYHIAGYCEFASNATGIRAARIVRNGATIMVNDYRMAVNGDITAMTVYIPFLMTATDYVELQVSQTSGGALTLNGAYLSVIKA